MAKFTKAYFQEQGRIGGRIGGVLSSSRMTTKQKRERALKAVAARERKRAERAAK